MGLSISGLGTSGLDVNSLVTQLMTAERAPQDRLSTQKTAALTRQTTWSSVNTSLTQLQAAVEAVKTPTSFNSSTATASDPSVLSATADGTATPASVTVRVNSLASAQQQASAGYASTATTVGAGSFLVAGGAAGAGITALTAAGIADGRHTLTVKSGPNANGNSTLTLDGTDYSVAVGNGPVSFAGLTLDGSGLTVGASVDLSVATTDATTTLAGLTGLLSSAGGPAAVAAVDLGSGANPAHLILSAVKAGTGNALLVSGTGGLSGLAAGFSVTQPASDAVVSMGSLSVTRSTNSISDLIPGVTLNLLQAAPGTDVAVTVGRDAPATSTKVKALVDGLNSTLDLLAKSSAYNTSTKTGQPLTGDSRVRELSNALSDLGSVFGTGTTATMDQLGISFTRDGRYTFDSTKLTARLKADPDGVADLVGKAAAKVSGTLDSALGKLGSRGWVQVASDGAAADAAQIQERIDDWDVRLTAMEQRYRTQWAAIDSAINSANSQKTWLSSTIAGLPKVGS